MTAEEWDACAEPSKMLESLAGSAPARRLMLFTLACGRRYPSVWGTGQGEGLVELCQRLLDAGERQADGADLSGEVQALLLRVGRQPTEFLWLLEATLRGDAAQWVLFCAEGAADFRAEIGSDRSSESGSC